MENLIEQMERGTVQNPEARHPPDYLDLRNGKLSMRADFINAADYTHTLPALLLNEGGPVSSLSSAAVPICYDFSQLLELESVTAEQRICDHLSEVALEGASLRVFANAKGELREIEERLTQIVEEDRMDMHSFSQNSLTNVCAYSALGEVEDILTIAIDPASKKYTE